MKKLVVSLFIVLLIVPLLSAINITVEKKSTEESVIYGLDRPAIFDLEVTNHGNDDTFEIYNLLGFKLEPTESFEIEKGETKNLQIKLYPRSDLRKIGYYSIPYFIQTSDNSEYKDRFTINYIDLNEALEIGSSNIDPESNKIIIYVENTKNIDLGEVNAKIFSAFFEFENKFNLGPLEKKEFEVQLNKEDSKKLLAGFYTINADVYVGDISSKIEGQINFVEKDIVLSTSRDYGFFITTKTISKSNEGNVVALSETVIKKNIISRLFTSFSPNPDFSERNGFIIEYKWTRSIHPGESLSIKTSTNWFYPFIIILLLIIITIFAKRITQNELSIKKKVSFVNAKGGEFALKVTISLRANKDIQRIVLIDKLPPLVKLFEKFGIDKPSKIDEKNRRIEWELNSLRTNEIRIISYVIYSKVGVLGKFSLPSATVLFEREGKIKESISNRAFFVSEQQVGEVEEEW